MAAAISSRFCNGLSHGQVVLRSTASLLQWHQQHAFEAALHSCSSTIAAAAATAAGGRHVDTIFALSSGQQRSAVAIVRITGPGTGADAVPTPACRSPVSRLFLRPPPPPIPHHTPPPRHPRAPRPHQSQSPPPAVLQAAQQSATVWGKLNVNSVSAAGRTENSTPAPSTRTQARQQGGPPLLMGPPHSACGDMQAQMGQHARHPG